MTQTAWVIMNKCRHKAEIYKLKNETNNTKQPTYELIAFLNNVKNIHKQLGQSFNTVNEIKNM